LSIDERAAAQSRGPEEIFQGCVHDANAFDPKNKGLLRFFRRFRGADYDDHNSDGDGAVREPLILSRSSSESPLSSAPANHRLVIGVWSRAMDSLFAFTRFDVSRCLDRGKYADRALAAIIHAANGTI